MKEVFGDKYKAFQTRYCNWRRRNRHNEKSKKARDANEL